MSYGSYAKNSTFPAPSGGSSAVPVDAVVVASAEVNLSGAALTLGDLVTSPGNSIELAWQWNDPLGVAGPAILWYTDGVGYAGTDFNTWAGDTGVGGPYNYTLRGFNAVGSYLDYTIAVTVVDNP